jgi:DNA-binding CsgD family transcriptional regulator
MLLDRRDELAAVDRVLAAIRDGLSGVLVLRGEAGIGKTVLLERALASAADLQVARVVGVQSEMELGYAGLHQLLGPFLGGLEGLPGPQRAALAAAFGLIEGSPSDRFLVGLGALTLLAGAAAEQPLVCVVDDAQWLDHASVEVLGFVARRLFADRVGMLFGVRDPAERSVALDGLPVIQMGGLPDRDARELLASVAPARVNERVMDRLIADTGANPLALTELAVELSPTELSGGSRLRDPLPLGARLEARFLERVRALPSDAQLLLLIAAADPSGEPALLWRAAAALGLDQGAVDLPEVDRLLVFTPRVAFRHPLIRSAVYHGASPGARRRVHDALAAVSDRGLDADRRAWHLAAAAIGPDEEVAAELERSAGRAAIRGGWAAAAAYLVRAAELSANENQRGRRLLRAAGAELADGSPAIAADYLRQARLGLTDPLEQAEGQYLAAVTRFALNDGRAAPALFLEAARALRPLDLRRAREVLLQAYEVSMHGGPFAGSASTAAVAGLVRETPLPPDTPPSAADLLLDGIACLDHHYADGARLITFALASAERADEVPNLSHLAAGEIGDDAALQALADRGMKQARERGDIMTLLPGLGYKQFADTLAGRLRAAEAAGFEARELAVASGNLRAIASCEMLDVGVLAWRGAEHEARAMTHAVVREATERGNGVDLNHLRVFMTALELAVGDYAAAVEEARGVYEEDPLYLGTAVLPGLIEAATRSDQPDVAAAALERLSERSLAAGTDLALGLLARSRALLAAADAADALYTEAIDLLARCVTPPELARARLLYGEWLRRKRRRRDAREHLRIAYKSFESMGIGAFAERARVELLATGEHARQRTAHTRDELTPQEALIARLASDGASNADIAAQLFISPATVAYHLRKVFRKLEITSRARLASALNEQGESAGAVRLTH